ncbi:MAG TPA: hypothetical protein VET26_04910 [Candidatus Sulfotelmatobacter sp.]|nr:hypothetical protein [Candidatus Sulfotelmatobacter sp.]
MNPVATVLMAVVYAAPIVLLWLRRDLETAIGFHFCTDLARFLAAYVAFQGWWFR